MKGSRSVVVKTGYNDALSSFHNYYFCHCLPPVELSPFPEEVLRSLESQESQPSVLTYFLLDRKLLYWSSFLLLALRNVMTRERCVVRERTCGISPSFRLSKTETKCKIIDTFKPFEWIGVKVTGWKEKVFYPYYLVLRISIHGTLTILPIYLIVHSTSLNVVHGSFVRHWLKIYLYLFKNFVCV